MSQNRFEVLAYKKAHSESQIGPLLQTQIS